MSKRQKDREFLTARAAAALQSDAPESGLFSLLQRNEGQPLAPTARAVVEPRLGHSFANVRVFASDEAAQVAESMDARALTVGSDIVFNRGTYPPQSREGDSVLAHELAHVSQNESAGAGLPWSGAALAERSARNDAAEVEARGAAGTVLAGGQAVIGAAPGALIAASPKDDEITSADVHQADVEEWMFSHSDVDYGATDKEQRRLRGGLKQNAAGARDRERGLAAEGSGSLEHLSLYDNTLVEGGKQVKRFQQAYGVFRLPMQMTLASLGRVQDVLTAGAPQTPHEMSRATRQVFHKLTGSQHDSVLKNVYGTWSRDTGELNKAMDTYMGVYTRLQGSLAQWREAKELLYIKQKRAELARDQKKLEHLEAPAKLIAGVLEVFEHGVSAYEAFKPEAAEAEPDAEVLQAASETDTDLRTGSQKGVSGAGKAKSLAKKGAGIVAGPFGLTTESVLNWAMGKSDEIEGLKRTIEKIKEDINDAGERAEDFRIDSAEQGLKGTTMENRAAALEVGARRNWSRQAADTFAGAMGGENLDARLVTLCAEAYQELRMMGEKALEAYAPVEAVLPAVQEFVSQSGHMSEIQWTRQHRRAAEEDFAAGGDPQFLYNDYEALMDAAGAARTYGSLIKKEYPDWAKRADAWAGFFGKETGMRLDEYEHLRTRGG